MTTHLLRIFFGIFLFLGINSNLKAEVGAATVYKITVKVAQV